MFYYLPESLQLSPKNLPSNGLDRSEHGRQLPSFGADAGAVLITELELETLLAIFYSS